MKAVFNGEATDPHQYPFQITFDKLAGMEAEAAAINQKGKQVLHIGTGWPGTAIGLYNKFGIPVTCLEVDQVVASRSAESLKKLGLYGEAKIQVLNLNGRSVNPKDFSTVIISAMVPTEDKSAIIQNMRDLAVDGVGEPLLVLRKPPDKVRELIYQPLPDGILSNQGLILMDQTQPGEGDPLRSLVYQVLPKAETRRGYDRFIIPAQQRLALL